MNERIRELLEQADVKYVTLPNGTVYEKFAKLIIRECLDIVDNADMSNLEGPDPEDVLYVVSMQIKQHFGVE